MKGSSCRTSNNAYRSGYDVIFGEKEEPKKKKNKKFSKVDSSVPPINKEYTNETISSKTD
jgi:hypothetical protein